MAETRLKIRTVVVDDEKPARDRIKRFLGEHPDFEIVGEAGDGDSAVQVIEETKPDLAFLDVQMPEADGFEVLERLDSPPRVVFATAYERYAVQAFEVHSIDYLLKPFDRKRFAAALARVRQEFDKRVPQEEKLEALLREIRESALARAEASSDRIPGRRGQKIYLLGPDDILWFEAEGEIVLARSGAHRYIVSRTLAELETTLDPRMFFRSHRSFIVNLSAIGEIVPEESGNYRIVMRDTERTAVPLSRRQARKLREVFPW